MTQGTTLLDPTSEKAGGMRRPIAPPPSLDRLTVGFLDISKPQGDIFLDRLETLFGERQIKVKRFAKLTSAKQASEEVIADIAENCDVVVEALAD